MMVLPLWLCILWLSVAEVHAGGLVELKLNEPTIVELKSTRRVVCLEPSWPILGFRHFASLFLETVIIVDFRDTPPPMFGVRSRSSDDLHDQISLVIRGALGAYSRAHSVSEIVDSTSLARDIVSSCRTPLWGLAKGSRCEMTSSSSGISCVSLPELSLARQDKTVTVTATRRNFRARYLINLGLCLFLLYFADPLAKSKVVQYSIGSAVFVFAGLLVLLFNIQRFLPEKRADSGSSVSAGLRSSLIFLAVSGMYVTAVTTFSEMIVKFCMDFWELAALYTATSGFVGCCMVRWLRSRDETKHLYKVTSKWVMRFVALVAGYNGFPSPTTSGCFVLALGFAWVLHWSSKNLGISSSASRSKVHSK